MKRKINVYFVVAIFVSIFYLFPLVLVVLNSLKGRIEIIQSPLAFPSSLELSNYVRAFQRMSYPSAFFNSLFVTIAANVVLIIFPGMLAYYLARFPYRMNKVVFGLLVASMIIPFQAIMIPFVSVYGGLGMLNSRFALVYFYLGFGTALATFMYHGFLKSVPIALDESALVEGANKSQVYFLVVFPMLRPITATIIILNSLWVWNDFLLPSLVLFQNARTLPLQTYTFFGQYTSEFGLAMAGLVLSIFPMILLYLFLQKHIISGITSGAVK